MLFNKNFYFVQIKKKVIILKTRRYKLHSTPGTAIIEANFKAFVKFIIDMLKKRLCKNDINIDTKNLAPEKKKA